MTLSSLGWDDALAASFQPYLSDGFLPARIALEHKHSYELLAEAGALAAECTGRFLHDASTSRELPAVGDWVAVRMRASEARGDIHAILPRRTQFSRRAAGEDREQVVAANVDTVFLVTGLDENFNLRRIERTLAMAWKSGAEPVVLLNKSDLHSDPAAARAAVEFIAPGVTIVVMSALAVAADIPLSTADLAISPPEMMLQPWLKPGRTIAFIGSSGVGKSTLINRLLGTDRQATLPVSSAVNKGRHTTTHRRLFVAPSGALVMDTPGMRELQLWDVDVVSLDTTFADVAALARQCRFGDCAHASEPGCAVVAALQNGSLAPERWASYDKLRREQAFAARRADSLLAREAKAARKKISREQRMRYRFREED